jgi:multiple sugar transport system permease protein
MTSDTLSKQRKPVVAATSSPPKNSRGRRRGGAAGRAPGTLALLVAPSVVVILLINAYPIVYAGNQSLHDGSLISSGNFVGFANYADILTDPTFWSAALFTCALVVVSVLGSWALGMGLSLLLKPRVPGGRLFKVLLLLPWIVPIVVSTTSWHWLLATSTSPIPQLFHTLGLGTPYFLADPTLAKFTVFVFEIWVNTPFMMMMTSSALTAVDDSVYEAARMDGATAWQQFSRLTLPLIARSTYISWILMTIFVVNDFPSVYLLTAGGPDGATTTLVVLAYQTVFHSFQTGPGVAIAFLMTFVLAVVAVVLYRRVRKADIA